MSTWVVGATIHGPASQEAASRLERALAAQGAQALHVVFVGGGRVRVSLHVEAATAEEAESTAADLLAGCSRAVGIDPGAVRPTAR